MATTTIPWGDGSGDNIYLTYPSASGDQTVEVSSDANAGAARTKTVTFSATGVSPVVLTVVQEAGVIITPVFYDYLLFDGSAYIDTDIVPVQDASFRVTMGLEKNESQQRCFGVSSDNGSLIQAFYNSNTNATYRVMAVYYDSSSALSAFNIPHTTPSYAFFLTPNGFGEGTTYNAITRGSTPPNGTLILGSVNGHTGYHFSGIMGLFRMFGSEAQNATSASDFDNYTPVKTLRPCTYGGQHGFWNVEDGKFYGNTAGIGSLIACLRLNTNVASYDSSDYSYYSASNLTNGQSPYSSSTYAQINLTRGSQAETYFYYKFDTSSIPADATIVGVYCSAKVLISTTTGNYVATRQLQMFSGTTAKGSASTISSTSATIYKLSPGTWTRTEINDVRIRLYAKRGTNNVNDARYFRFYGATLNVLYTV